MPYRLQYSAYGGPEVMSLQPFTPDRPVRAEVLVRVRAAAANPVDWKIRAGQLKIVTGRRFPKGVGYDFSGVVEQVGDATRRLKVGDEVAGSAPVKTGGAFGELVIAEEASLAHKPVELSFPQAATLPTVGVTAYQVLVKRGQLRAGQSVFVNGCLGGVGRTAVQLALSLGAGVGGSCREGSADQALALGVAPIVGFGFAPAAIEQRFDIVFDTAGTLPTRVAKQLLKPDGKLFDINGNAGKFVRSALPGPYKLVIAKPSVEDLDRVLESATRREIQVPIARTVSLPDAIPALTELETQHSPRGGKLVVVPD